MPGLPCYLKFYNQNACTPLLEPTALYIIFSNLVYSRHAIVIDSVAQNAWFHLGFLSWGGGGGSRSSYGSEH